MKLLTDILPDDIECPELQVSGLHYDSRKIKPGNVFFAIDGFSQNGENFIPQAIEKGAVAIVVSEKSNYSHPDIPVVSVNNIRRIMAYAAGRFYVKAASEMNIIGITGTNGKTTTSHIIHSLLQNNGHPSALMGTIYYKWNNHVEIATHTTPESVDLHRYFYEFFASGIQYVVMEVSSHALALERVWGIPFKVGVFTNLSRDHMDFHSSMDDYFQAKLKLFQNSGPDFKAVVNLDDPYGQKLVQVCKGDIYTYSKHDTRATVQLLHVDYRLEGTWLEVRTPAGNMQILSPLIGEFNTDNLMAAIATGFALKLTYENITNSIQNLPQIPGRCEKITLSGNKIAVIDYAHTPDALKKICSTLMKLTGGRLFTVFGAGGNRDQGKRAQMGQVAEEFSDVVFLTSDNPRDEEPHGIIQDIMKGIHNTSLVIVEPDRRKAIHRALDMAGRNDVVLIAGKGHENYQEIKGKRYHFNDLEVVEEWNNQMSGI